MKTMLRGAALLSAGVVVGLALGLGQGVSASKSIDSALPLEELYEKRISRLETRALWAGRERIPHDRYQWPLALALGCLLGLAGLREGRPLPEEER